jgi:hypothetical protein
LQIDSRVADKVAVELKHGTRMLTMGCCDKFIF